MGRDEKGREPSQSDLSDDDLRTAAAGDLTVFALLMLIGSAVFAAANLWFGTLGLTAAALTVASTFITTSGLMRGSPPIAAFVKVGLGFSGVVAPIVGVAGLAIALFGYKWGWAVLAGAIVYFLFSLLGLEIIERALRTGALEPFEGFDRLDP